MTKKTSEAFTSTPRGYTSVNGVASWLEPKFQADALAARRQLEPALNGMTKAQLAAFIADAGGYTFEGQREKKADLVCRALNLQVAAWYPAREVTR